MNDFSAVMKLIRKAVCLKRSKEIAIVSKAADIPPECRCENINQSITVAVSTETGQKQHRCNLYGYMHDKTFLLDNPGEEVMKALLVLEQEDLMLGKITSFMCENEKDRVMEMCPSLVPFIIKAEEISKKEKQEKIERSRRMKEEEHRKWKEAYETCLRLFGDRALG